MVGCYLGLLEQGELRNRVQLAFDRLAACDLCPLRCGVNRLKGEVGICKTGYMAMVSSYGPHFGEESPLSGWRGSGTIFFTCCNLRCVYCQNADISQTPSGYEVNAEQIAKIMLDLQSRGCHNINLVSPTHVVPQVLAAIELAAQTGLHLPIVYNTGGYDSLDTLTLLDGVVDIYMPDMKYSNPIDGLRYSKVKDYPKTNQAAVLEMQRQVGDLQIDKHGIAQRGLLVRHLVLPNNQAGSEKVFQFLAEKVTKTVYLNLMAQYHPSYKAHQFSELSRRITPGEYQAALTLAQRFGLTRVNQA